MADDAAQRLALVSLYSHTVGNAWTRSDGWTVGEPCGDSATGESPWHGLECDADGRIARLDLKGNMLRGTIPSELRVLEYLRSIDLSSNPLSGTLPSSLGTFEHLREKLSIYDTRVSGTIPSSFGQLPSLRGSLNLFWNRLSGTVPTTLSALHLDECALTSGYLVTNAFACDNTVRDGDSVHRLPTAGVACRVDCHEASPPALPPPPPQTPPRAPGANASDVGSGDVDSGTIDDALLVDPVAAQSNAQSFLFSNPSVQSTAQSTLYALMRVDDPVLATPYAATATVVPPPPIAQPPPIALPPPTAATSVAVATLPAPPPPPRPPPPTTLLPLDASGASSGTGDGASLLGQASAPAPPPTDGDGATSADAPLAGNEQSALANGGANGIDATDDPAALSSQEAGAATGGVIGAITVSGFVVVMGLGYWKRRRMRTQASKKLPLLPANRRMPTMDVDDHQIGRVTSINLQSRGHDGGAGDDTASDGSGSRVSAWPELVRRRFLSVWQGGTQSANSPRAAPSEASDDGAGISNRLLQPQPQSQQISGSTIATASTASVRRSPRHELMATLSQLLNRVSSSQVGSSEPPPTDPHRAPAVDTIQSTPDSPRGDPFEPDDGAYLGDYLGPRVATPRSDVGSHDSDASDAYGHAYDLASASQRPTCADGAPSARTVSFGYRPRGAAAPSYDEEDTDAVYGRATDRLRSVSERTHEGDEEVEEEAEEQGEEAEQEGDEGEEGDAGEADSVSGGESTGGDSPRYSIGSDLSDARQAIADASPRASPRGKCSLRPHTASPTHSPRSPISTGSSSVRRSVHSKFQNATRAVCVANGMTAGETLVTPDGITAIAVPATRLPAPSEMSLSSPSGGSMSQRSTRRSVSAPRSSMRSPDSASPRVLASSSQGANPPAVTLEGKRGNSGRLSVSACGHEPGQTACFV